MTVNYVPGFESQERRKILTFLWRCSWEAAEMLKVRAKLLSLWIASMLGYTNWYPSRWEYVVTRKVFLSCIISEHSEYIVPEELWPEIKAWCSGATRGLRKDSCTDIVRWQQHDFRSYSWKRKIPSRYVVLGCFSNIHFPFLSSKEGSEFPESAPWLS